MKKSINLSLKIVIFLLSITLFNSKVFAQDDIKIHLIQILDYRPSDSQDGDYWMAKNAGRTLSRMKEEILNFAGKFSISDSKITELVFSNQGFSPGFEKNKILSEIQKLQLSKNDIVFLVYFGHGFEDGKLGSKYPNLILDAPEGVKVDIEQQMRMYSVNAGFLIDKIIEKRPGVVLSLITACNDNISVNNDDLAYIPKSQEMKKDFAASGSLGGILKERYLDLLGSRENETKSIEFISSIPGQKSYFNEDTYGGFFFQAFQEVFAKYIREKNSVSWSSIAIETYKKTVNSVFISNSKLQQPIGLIRYFSNNSQKPYKEENLTKEIAKTHKPEQITKPISDNPIISETNGYSGDINPIVVSYDLAVRFAKLGNSYRAAGNRVGAEKVLISSIASLESKAPNSFELATAYENMGLLQKDNNNTQQAREYLNKALAIYQSLNAKGSEQAIQSILNNLK